MALYAIRTTANKEKNVASKLADRINKDKYAVASIVVPGLKGYLLVEGELQEVDKAYRGITHARGIVDGQASLSEIEHFLKPKAASTTLAEGYIVEVSSGPFKGEKAKITSVDTTKNEVTIELVEAMVAIPITLAAEHVRVLEKDDDAKDSDDDSDEKPRGKDSEDPFSF